MKKLFFLVTFFIILLFSNCLHDSVEFAESDTSEEDVSHNKPSQVSDESKSLSEPGDDEQKGLKNSELALVESTADYSVFKLKLAEVELTESEYKGRKVSRVEVKGLDGTSHEAGLPVLPFANRSLMLDAKSLPSLDVKVKKQRFVAAAPPMPSIGFRKRIQDSTVEPEFGEFYESSAKFPSSNAILSEKYHIREVCGVDVKIFPVQYDNQRQGYLIAEDVEVTVHHNSVSKGWQYAYAPVADFDRMISSRFVNSSLNPSMAYTQDKVADKVLFSESGNINLLVITSSNFVGKTADFIKWKRQLGYQVAEVQYPGDTGYGVYALAAYIKNKYTNDAISHVILLGDSDDIPVEKVSNPHPTRGYQPIPTDSKLAMVSGDDLYEDLLISRICANNSTEAEYQLWKIVAYEQNQIGSGSWYGRGIFVGGQDDRTEDTGKTYLYDPKGEYDWQILDREITRLSDAGYISNAVRIYDNVENDDFIPAADLNARVNEGATVCYFLGHGTELSWVRPLNRYEWQYWYNADKAYSQESGLSNSLFCPLYVLTNCNNGTFTYVSDGAEIDCLAESLMKAGSKESQAGACGAMSSTTIMDWEPPVVFLRNFNNAMSSGDYETVGGMMLYGKTEAIKWCKTLSIISANYTGEKAAKTLAYQFHLFGDCTMRLRIKEQSTINVAQDQLTGLNETQVQLSVSNAGSGISSAKICYEDGGELKFIYSDSSGSNTFVRESLEAIPLVVSKSGFMPWVGEVARIPAFPISYIVDGADIKLSDYFGAGTFNIVSGSGYQIVDGALVNTSGSHASVELKIEQITQDGTVYHYLVVSGYDDSVSYSYDLAQGWNLIGVPGKVSQSLGQLLSDSGGNSWAEAWKWDVINKFYQSAPSANVLDPQEALWVNAQKDYQTVEFNVETAAGEISEENNEWILYSPSSPGRAPFAKAISVWQWDKEKQSYSQMADDDALQPGIGYWVFLKK